MKKIMFAALMLALILPVSSYAQPEMTTAPAGSILKPLPVNFYGRYDTEKMDTDTFANKMGEGLINVATSWTDVPRQIDEVSKESNILVGYTVGFGKGLILGIVRSISGTIEATASTLPPYDQPLLKPEYKVDNPDKEGYKIPLFKW